MTLPNLLSLARLAMLPVLLWLVWTGNSMGFFWVLLLAFGTDLLDGFLARRLGLVTPLGARLDSAGDLVVFLTALLGVVRLFPALMRRYAPLVLACLALFAAAQIVSLVRFRRPVIYHSWLAKATGGVAAIAVLGLLWVGRDLLLAKLACVMGVLAQAEQWMITVVVPTPEADTPSLWHAAAAWAATRRRSARG